MKKGVSLLLIMLLVFMLAACGGAKNNADPQTEPSPAPVNNTQEPAKESPVATGLVPEAGAELVVWESGGAIGEWTKWAAGEYTKKYGVPVTFEEVGHTDAPGKMVTDGPAGLGADVFAAPHDHLGQLVVGGLVLPNDFPEQYQKDFIGATIDGTTMDGELYGYPTSIETYGLFYNKDLVKQLPETWDQLFDQAKAFTDVNKNNYGFMMEVSNFYFVYAFMGGYGGYVFGDHNTNPNEVGLNNEGSVKAGEFLNRIHKEILPLKDEDITYDIKQSLFNSGNLMFNLDGPWAVAGHRDAGVNFGVMPFPKLDNGVVPTSFSGIRAFYVNAYSKYPDAAALLAQFMTSEELLLKRFEMTGQLPPVTALLDNPTVKNDEVAAAFLEQASHAVPMPNIPEMVSVWDPMKAALSTIWNDGTNVKAALDSGVQLIMDAISTNK